MKVESKMPPGEGVARGVDQSAWGSRCAPSSGVGIVPSSPLGVGFLTGAIGPDTRFTDSSGSRVTSSPRV
jgi:aryl-alcohol dehydrogenase-like predicted oxidoreductase